MLHKTVKQEPAGLRSRAIGVSIGQPQITLVHHPEFEDAVIEPLFARCAIGQVKPPPVQFWLEAMFVDIGHHMAVAVGVFEWRGIGVFFEITIEHDFIAVFKSIDEVQNKSRLRLKPADIFWLTITRAERETRGQPFVQPRHMDIALQQLCIPEKWEVAQY